METFTFCPRVSPTATVAQRSLVAQFGDGYAQRAGDGINGTMESWPLEFVGDTAYIRPIKEFLDRHGGWKSFLWTAPLGEEQHYVTPGGYTYTPIHADMFSLSVTLQQNNRLV